MKLLPKILSTTSALLLFAVAAQADQNVQQILSEAQTAYVRGDLDAAKRGFELVNKADPKNQTAIGFLRMIRAQEAKGAKGNPMEKQLANIMIPKVEFRDATLGSALDYLKRTVSKVTDEKQSVNFVVQLPEEQVKSTAVTLSLTNVPFSEVLKYLGGLANVQFEYDRYAITVKPKTAGATASAAPSGAQ